MPLICTSNLLGDAVANASCFASTLGNFWNKRRPLPVYRSVSTPDEGCSVPSSHIEASRKKGARCPTFWSTGFRPVAMHTTRMCLCRGSRNPYSSERWLYFEPVSDSKASTTHVVRRSPVEFSARFMMQNQQLPIIYIGVQSE
jgi:hypothetical protein